MPRELPSFDLIVATVGRTGELRRFLESLTAQDYPRTRLLVVDQNEDNRVDAILSASPLTIAHLRAERGLSRARNVGLAHIEADVVAFPDDDCVYPTGFLYRIAERLAEAPDLDGLTGRAVGFDGRASASWRADRAVLRRDDIWNRAISFTIFLRRASVETVGEFDIELGLGSGTPWHSGEEVDYLIRAVDRGGRIEYDPALVVQHELRVNTVPIGLRDGASVGYLLRKHGYPPRAVGRMLVRPVGGALASLAHLDTGAAQYHVATLRGRVRGYLGASRSKISA